MVDLCELWSDEGDFVMLPGIDMGCPLHTAPMCIGSEVNEFSITTAWRSPGMRGSQRRYMEM